MIFDAFSRGSTLSFSNDLSRVKVSSSKLELPVFFRLETLEFFLKAPPAPYGQLINPQLLAIGVVPKALAWRVGGRCFCGFDRDTPEYILDLACHAFEAGIEIEDESFRKDLLEQGLTVDGRFDSPLMFLQYSPYVYADEIVESELRTEKDCRSVKLSINLDTEDALNEILFKYEEKITNLIERMFPLDHATVQRFNSGETIGVFEELRPCV